ncbi:hypothetical protein EDC01DRAFT_634558 [Geopyxis carbonaria]|nr:hypothetical protein EDC01DRAFT_634558 [Geopyxis carbonaria]
MKGIYNRLTAPATPATRSLTGLSKLRHVLLGPADPLTTLHSETARVTALTTSEAMSAPPECTDYAYYLLAELEDTRVHYHEAFAKILITRSVVAEEVVRAEVWDIQCGGKGHWSLPELAEDGGRGPQKEKARLREVAEALEGLDGAVREVAERWEVELDERGEEFEGEEMEELEELEELEGMIG